MATRSKSGKGPVLLVTGGSRGIGAATARLAAAQGYRVAVNYNSNGKAAARTVQAIEKAGGTAVAIQADVSQEDQVISLFEETEARFGPIYGLVNNAGIIGSSGRVENLTAETLEAVMRLNVIGAFFCAREAVKRMSTRNGGSGGAIVNVSSRASTLGSPGEFVHYAASKGAVDSMTIGLAREVGREGIRVNAVSPGLILTEIHGSVGDAGRLKRLVGSVPLGRVGSALEVAKTIVFLLSPHASYVTGTIVDVSGGR
ncbi:SDR family oxidoreductase [Hypericibacter sp.]|uniref:SDR family oxidoreductase n=1 Tax=Hypericibacter sp. TaxID=2705401 RepID=UPI003D6C8917